MKHLLLFIICLFLVSTSVQSQISGIPHKVSYQGVVKYLDAKGKTKYPKVGSYTLSFNFYEDSSATLISSGLSKTVTVGKYGVYTTTLGEDGTEVGNLWLDNKLLWMKVIVLTAPTKSGLPTVPYTIPGIIQLTSVPYAYLAEKAVGLVANSNVWVNSIYASNSIGATGVVGSSTVPGGAGVYGYHPYDAGVYGDGASVGVEGTSSTGTGVYGVSTDSYGVMGISSNGFGMAGTSTNTDGIVGEGKTNGIRGVAFGTEGNGVKGTSTGENGTGIYGIANNGSLAYGVWGYSTSGYAGYFTGKTHVSGTLSKSAGSFKIDHPLDPANKYLYHSFVESPDMKNIYDGTVQLDGSGQAEVTLPDWFGALNKDFRYQLTAIGNASPNLHVAKEIETNRFAIAGGTPGGKVSWQVTGIRQDAYANAHRIPVEENKQGKEQGSYIHPELFGASPELSVEHATHPNAGQEKEIKIPELSKIPLPTDGNK